MGALGTLGAWSSGLVVAQSQQASAPSAQLAEVVVTAQYREEKLQDTPIAISAFTSQTIEEQGAQVMSDILGSAPSVNFRPHSAAFGESVSASIRGFGQVDFDPAFEPGVGMYIDDVYYPRLTGANFDLMDVERVEVLRGPQGTLYGKDSEGGAIRFVSRKPTGDGAGVHLGHLRQQGPSRPGRRLRLHARRSSHGTPERDVHGPRRVTSTSTATAA